LKIESLEAYPIKIRARERLQGGTFGYTHYQTVLVKAACDGVEGWGEAMTRADPVATALLVRYLGKSLVGEEFGGAPGAWKRCWGELRIRGHTRGTDVEALSGIEIALQDCEGKILRKPLCGLFASRPADEVPVFAGSLFASRGSLEEQVERAKEKGLTGAKVKIGFGVGRDKVTLAGVRKLWPEGMLVADANGAYDEAGAAKACAAFRDLDLAWFEEPVLSDDLAGYASLRGLGIRIGAGESWFVGDFDSALAGRLVDVLEPSVSRCGGVSVEMKAAAAAIKHGVEFSPMTGMNSAISLAASLHAAAARKSVGVEYNPFTNPLQTELAEGVPKPRGGKLRVPSGNGLGITIDQRFVRSHSA
jgi:L-alanine-DL-glutamate epimerase-like enolase superfamily enzyme